MDACAGDISDNRKCRREQQTVYHLVAQQVKVTSTRPTPPASLHRAQMGILKQTVKISAVIEKIDSVRQFMDGRL
jgi:hypothetical protein